MMTIKKIKQDLKLRGVDLSIINSLKKEELETLHMLVLQDELDIISRIDSREYRTLKSYSISHEPHEEIDMVIRIGDLEVEQNSKYNLPRKGVGLVNISEWYGRFGNNVQQLIHAYLLSDKFDCEFFYPKHLYFKAKDWVTYASHVKKWCGIPYFHVDDTLFFRTEFEEKYFNVNIHDERRICRDKIAKEIISIPNYDIPEDVIVIHVRGGDVFMENPHSGYLQPPLAYYIAIIEKEAITDLSKVWIITESGQPRNPVVDILEKMGCKIFTESLAWSVVILSNAKRGVLCKSSFSKFSFFLSNKIKKLYAPDYVLETDNIQELTDINLFKVNLPNYIEQGTWEASQKQLSTMINYDSNITIDKFGE